jgi:DNA sulfur modification protein DndD
VIDQFETSSEIGQILQATSDEIKLTSVSIQGASEGARLLNQRIVELKADESKLIARRDEISAIIANHDADAIARLGRERGELQEQRLEVLGDNARLERQMVEHAARIERSKKAYEKATEGDGEVARLRAVAALATKAAGAAGQIHSLVLEMVRKKLESSIDERFSRLVKKGPYKTEITEDFMIRTVDDLGNYDNLSEGQSMLKAFVFSMALRDVVGLRLPLLVDTPYGRLSERHRQELSQMLAALVADSAEYDGNQVIFLMHDSEYTPYTRRHFLDYNPLETFLSRDDEADVSKLGAGIDPEWLQHTAWKDWAEGLIK